VDEFRENYVSLDIASRFRAQAWRVWTAGLAVVAFWVALILAAPIAKANGGTAISSPIYSFFSYLCHQTPERSFHVAGEQFGVCSRCFGIYLGILIGFIIYPLWRVVDTIDPLPKVWLFFACVPAAIDWSLTIFGIWENTHLSRVLTGGLLGFACATFIVPSIVEITRNFTLRRGTLGSRTT
jgi:uncharacterized membrane protein